MEDDNPTCYMCRCEIRNDSDNWIVVDTAFCKYLVCETCCDERSGDFESDDEDVDMTDMKNALEESLTKMEDSEEESSSEEES